MSQVSLPQVPIPAGWNFRDIQLEMSLKPFFDATPATREAVVREVFEQWRALWRHAESVSVMLWIAEGSEILEYGGDLSAEFEWARYHGAPNRHRWVLPKPSGKRTPPDHQGIGANAAALDPEAKGLHSRAYLYRDDPAVFTFGWLRDLVTDIKKIGGEMTGRPVYVGETFDIGPEFAKSRFKFDWHREILGDGPIFKEQFITCEAVLKGDDRAYAAYPQGIPDGTRFGTFFGKQLHCLFRDMGFDFLWLSNGFGFSLEPWAMVGEVFDGAVFRGDRSAGIRERILRFWTDLRAEFPLQYPIRTRGTNMATGIDVGSDASPLREIYAGNFGVDAPVNSPWAALDGDFGLELSGWMSHVARHPGETFRFRFYTHDPWWMNSPWLDRYARQPHDLFLPLSVSRLLPGGGVEIPRDIAFLTIDDSHGIMPLTVPNEVIAHLLAARETAPDAPAPLLWVYPFDEIHDGPPERALHGDAFIGAAINDGVPLNSVVDVRDLPAHPLPGVILVAPVPLPGAPSEAALLRQLDAGAQVLLYGAMPEGSPFLKRLGLRLDAPLSGDFRMADGRSLSHLDFLSAGGVRTCGGSPLHVGELNGQKRTLSAVAGNLVWTRASLSTGEFDPENPQPIRGPILKPLDPARFFPPGQLLRETLVHFGWRIEAETRPVETRMPYLTAHRWHNGLILSGHHRDEQAVLRVRHPLGAPLLKGRYNQLRGGLIDITGDRAWRSEVRVLVEKGEDAIMECREVPSLMNGVHRRLLVFGAQNADLVFFPEPGMTATLRILLDPIFPYFVGDLVEPRIENSPHGPIVRVPNVNGSILFEW